MKKCTFDVEIRIFIPEKKKCGYCINQDTDGGNRFALSLPLNPQQPQQPQGDTP